MTITEKFQNKRCVFSIECFPPKQTTQMDKMKATLQAMRALNPDFISVTFGAGGSAGGVSTVEVADYFGDSDCVSIVFYSQVDAAPEAVRERADGLERVSSN